MPSPFKYCPNCKSNTISSDDGHRFHCQDCQFEYFHNAAATVAAIIICNNEVLLTVRAKEPELGKFDLPGGFVDHNESLEQALTREVKEELGFEHSDWCFLCSDANTYEYNGVLYYTCDAIFTSTLDSKPVVSPQESEISDVKWMSIEELNSVTLGFKSLQNALQRFLSQHTEQ